MKKKIILTICLLTSFCKINCMFSPSSLLPFAKTFMSLGKKTVTAITSLAQAALKKYRLYGCQNGYEQLKRKIKYGYIKPPTRKEKFLLHIIGLGHNVEKADAFLKEITGKESFIRTKKTTSKKSSFLNGAILLQTFHLACMRNKFKIAQLISNKNNYQLSSIAAAIRKKEFGEDLLKVACEDQHLEILKILFKNGWHEQKLINAKFPRLHKVIINANPALTGLPPIKPVLWAYINSNVAMLKCLVENGADCVTTSLDRKTEALRGFLVRRNQTSGTKNLETLLYLSNAFDFKEAKNKLEFVLHFINKNQVLTEPEEEGEVSDCRNLKDTKTISQETKDIIRLAFCNSLINALKNGENFWFAKLNAKAQTDPIVKHAILQTFEIEDENLLKEKNTGDLISYVIEKIDLSFAKSQDMLGELEKLKMSYENMSERHRFLARQQELGNRVTIETDDRTLSMLNLFSQQ